MDRALGFFFSSSSSSSFCGLGWVCSQPPASTLCLAWPTEALKPVAWGAVAVPLTGPARSVHERTGGKERERVRRSQESAVSPLSFVRIVLVSLLC